MHTVIKQEWPFFAVFANIAFPQLLFFPFPSSVVVHIQSQKNSKALTSDLSLVALLKVIVT